jgi:hypothetical protein
MVALVSVAVNNPCTVLQIYNNAMEHYEIEELCNEATNQCPQPHPDE